jgi:protein disulfide-isomerase
MLDWSPDQLRVLRAAMNPSFFAALTRLDIRRCVTAVLFGCGLMVGVASASDKPYDDGADTARLMSQALTQARAEHKPVLVVFGANWCPDCRHLDAVLHGPDASGIHDKYVLLKLSVGSFDRNLDVARQLDVPLSKGIPAIAVLDQDGKSQYITRAGELADARSMGDVAVVGFIEQALTRSAIIP